MQLTAANGLLGTPSATVELQFEVADLLFEECFIVMITSPIFGLPFRQRNSIKFDMRQGAVNFLFFSMKLKHADKSYSMNNEPSLNLTEFLVKQGKQNAIYIKSQVYAEKKVRGIIQPPRPRTRR